MEDQNTHKNSRTVTVAIILLIIFVLILILFLYLIRKPALFGSFAQSGTSSSTTTNTVETITPQNISLENSYLFASPLKAAAGVERIRITAYILDGQGMGVVGKNVVLGESASLRVYPINAVTDTSGRAVFDISSDKTGLFTIEASVDGKKVSQKVSVTFN